MPRLQGIFGTFGCTPTGTRLVALAISAVVVCGILWLASPVVMAADIGFENIYTDYIKTYSHFAPAGLHTDTENYKAMPLVRRHASCNDCHDPHSAMATPSPLGSYFGAGTQANVSGVRAFYTGVPAGGTPTYVFLSAVVKEYELCFKCHSGYSWGTQTLPKFNWTRGRYWMAGDSASDVIVQETDTAKELNPNNASYHPVVAKGKRPGSERYGWAGNRTFNQTFVPGRNANSVIKCSDCHGSDSTTVKGPHGSNYKYILKRPAPSTEPTYMLNAGRIGNLTYNIAIYQRTSNIVCYECHDVIYYGPGRGHPDGGHAGASPCLGHAPMALDQIGCTTCKVVPIHGDTSARWLMKQENYCYICHHTMSGYETSCPRFYSITDRGKETEETRVHFQSSRVKPGSNYFIPLPTPDMPNLKGLGNVPAYRYYNREDDYILFKHGAPAVANGMYKVKFDQPSSGDRPDGEPVGEIGYEDSIALWTIDHTPTSWVYLSVDGGVHVTNDKNIVLPVNAVDNKGNNVLDVISQHAGGEYDKSNWFAGEVGYGNTIDEIYANGNWFTLDFGDLSKAKTIKLIWSVNELKGAKLPIFIQTKDENGKWVTRGSARHAEDRHGYMDIKGFFPAGTKSYQIRVIPTLNFVDHMAVSVKDEPYKLTKLSLQKAEYTKYKRSSVDVTPILKKRDGAYLPFDYRDQAQLYFKIPAAGKSLTKRDFVFAPVGYYEAGGPVNPDTELEPMTAEKAQDFARVTPAGGYANHYNVQPLDPDDWNERHPTK